MLRNHRHPAEGAARLTIQSVHAMLDGIWGVNLGDAAIPAAEKNALAKADYDDMILWLACREAKALLFPKENPKSTDKP